MKVYTLSLQHNWLERPYFGREFYRLLNHVNPSINTEAQSLETRWVSDGMQCRILSDFLETGETGGLFLLAGTRGIGKTSLIRCSLKHWHEKNIETQVRSEYYPIRLIERRKLKKEKQKYKFQVVDAADLGLFEKNIPDLERVLVVGLLRTLQEVMIPHTEQSWFGDRYFQNIRNRFWKTRKARAEAELVMLTQIAVAQQALIKTEAGVSHQEHITGTAGLNLKSVVPFLESTANLGADRRRTSNRHTQLIWSNSTDALRAELRALFRRYADLSWPILVLDEWDRFEDDYESGTEKDKPDTSTNSREQQDSKSSAERASDNTPPSPTAEKGGGQKSPPQKAKPTASRPNLDDALRALSSIKSLLADYPAPVIIIGGESIYKKVRRNKHRTEASCKPELPYATIFSQHCFISPLPVWQQPIGERASRAYNPLEPYLAGISQAGAQGMIAELADYLLMEIGPNPHALKLFIGHYEAADGTGEPVLKMPRTKDTLVKAMMGQAVLKTLYKWEHEYSGIVAAGPYQRLCWFRYLRNRLLKYWKSPYTWEGRDFYLPKGGEHIPHNPPLPNVPALLHALEDTCEVVISAKNSNSNQPAIVRRQVMESDLYLLHMFHQEYLSIFPPPPSSKEEEEAAEDYKEPWANIENKPWETWICQSDLIGESEGKGEVNARCYFLDRLAEQLLDAH